jgi:hypothetical protein
MFVLNQPIFQELRGEATVHDEKIIGSQIPDHDGMMLE